MIMVPFILLIEAALRALLVALVVWAGLRLFRVGNVMAQKAAWTMVLAASVAMPLMMRWQGLPAFATLRVPQSYLGSVMPNSPHAEPGMIVAPASAPPTPTLNKPSAAFESTDASGDRFPAPVISKSKYGASSAAPLSQSKVEPVAARESIVPHPVASVIHRQLVVGFVYFAIAAVLIFRMMLGLAAALRLWLGAEQVLLDYDSGPFARSHVRSTSAIASPVTIGSGVLLPADYIEWDAEKLRIVLAHERSHIHQGDFYLQLVAALYSALFWFSPLGWWLKAKLSNLGEAIGDHAALNQAASPASYAQLLLEFAAMPRPTLIGVAMARPSTISQRVERLLNDSTFRQAFAGSKSRALLAVLIVPVAIFAATAMLRVEAGSVAQSPAPASPASPTSPAPPSSPDPAPAPGQLAAPTAVPQPPLAAPGADAAFGADSVLAPVPPQPPGPPEVLARPDVHISSDLRIIPDVHVQPDVHVNSDALVIPDVDVRIDHELIRKQVQEQVAAMKMLKDARAYQFEEAYGDHSGYSYGYSKDGESWGIVSGPGDKTRFSGDWNGLNAEAIEKARKVAHGQFLWFTKNGKSYLVDDPAVVAQIEEMYKPMQELGRQQAELGHKQAELGKLQGELGRQMGQAKFTAPDLSKEMADLTAAMSKLQAEMGKEITREQLAEVQGKLAQLQGRLGAMYGRSGVSEDELGAKMGKLGEEQGKLGAEQGKLGAEQGTMGREAEQKVRSIIEESLKSGKAKPVE
jgi:beta-lactamase regulating signal transducer with metallopeptidase domain/uncharacterized protein YlzI (FlbEa/FlbD family)